MKEIKKLFRKTIICVSTFISFVTLYMPNVYAMSYQEAEFLWDYLTVDDWINVIFKVIGNGIYDLLRPIMNAVENAFNEIARLDIMQAVSIGNILRNIDVIIPIIITILIVIAVFVYMFKLQNPLKIINNGIIVALALVSFSTLVSLADSFKLAMLTEVDNIVEKQDYMLTDKLYADNTVDVVASVKNKQLTYADATTIRFIDRYERADHKYIKEYPSVNSDTGEVTYDTLRGGFLGMGRVSYFRYSTNFLALNVTILVSIFIYILGIFKIALLMIDWFKMNVYARIAVTRGIFDYNLIGNIIKSFGQNIVGVIITYSSMLLFTIFINGIIASNVHWIASCICIYAFGIKILVGSAAINQFFGIDDSFKSTVAGAFALNRMAKGLTNGVKGTANKLGKAKDFVGDKMQDSYNNISDDYQKNVYDNLDNNKDLHSALNEDKPQYEKDQMKDKILDKEHNENVKDQALKELHGDDYKTKMAKDNILKKEQEEKQKQDALKSLYGDDYKTKMAKDNILKKEQEEKQKQDALKSLYGDDYKVDMEKDKIGKRQDKAKTHHEAMQQIYGTDYKQKQAVSRAQEKVNEYALIDSLRKGENLEYQKTQSLIEEDNNLNTESSISEEEFQELLEKYD